MTYRGSLGPTPDNATNPLRQPLYHCQCGWMGDELNWSRLTPRKGLFKGYCPRCGRQFEGVFRTAKEIRMEEQRPK